MVTPVAKELSDALVGPASGLVTKGNLLCSAAYADAVAKGLQEGKANKVLCVSNGQGAMEAAVQFRLPNLELHAVISGEAHGLTNALFSQNAATVPLLTKPDYRDYDGFVYDPPWGKHCDRFRATPAAYGEPLQNLLSFGKLTVAPLPFSIDISWVLMVNANALKTFDVLFRRVENNWLAIFKPQLKS